YYHLVLPAYPYQFAAQTGEAAHGDFHEVALFIYVGAYLHLCIAAAEDPQVVYLCLGDGNRLVLYHDELDHTINFAYREIVTRYDLHANIGAYERFLNQLLAVRPLAEGLLEREEGLNAQFFYPVT